MNRSFLFFLVKEKEPWKRVNDNGMVTAIMVDIVASSIRGKINMRRVLWLVCVLGLAGVWVLLTAAPLA